MSVVTVVAQLVVREDAVEAVEHYKNYILAVEGAIEEKAVHKMAQIA